MEQEKKSFDHAFAFKDNSSIAETFADGVHFITMDGATGRIVFTVSRADKPKGSPKQPPSGTKALALRLVLSSNGMIELYNQLHQLFSGMEQMGMVQREGGPPVTRQ